MIIAASKLPKFSDKHKICIICEGNEEYSYLNRLKKLNVWSEQYDISLVDADGNGNISARYQDKYQNGAEEVIIFGNPCTMQLICKHWTDDNLRSPSKSVNSALIMEHTGVEHYKGRADQIKRVMEYVTADNYADMCKRVKTLSTDDLVI